MRYEEVSPISRARAQEDLASGDSTRAVLALLRSAFHDPDWRWVQGQCLFHLTRQDKSLQRMAAICLGHLARIHHTLDLDVVVPALEQVLRDPNIAAQVQDALDDIRVFAKNPVKGS
jgi:hypothetical protein